MTNVEKALELVADGMTLGLGSGAASAKFVDALGARVKAGLRVRGVPTSNATAAQATRLGIPLVPLEDGMPLDVAFDGADEVAPNLDLIKGYGRALLREKIVAAAARKFVILVGPERAAEKIVPALGSRKKLPVEVVPFALPLVARKVAELGYPGDLYKNPDGSPFVSDNGNPILDLRVGPLENPRELEYKLRAIPGVVDTGFFLGMADLVLIQDGDKLDVRERGKG